MRIDDLKEMCSTLDNSILDNMLKNELLEILEDIFFVAFEIYPNTLMSDLIAKLELYGNCEEDILLPFYKTNIKELFPNKNDLLEFIEKENLNRYWIWDKDDLSKLLDYLYE